MLWKTMKWLKSTHHLVLLLKQYFGRIAAGWGSLQYTVEYHKMDTCMHHLVRFSATHGANKIQPSHLPVACHTSSIHIVRGCS